jgi:hypothetical protein
MRSTAVGSSDGGARLRHILFLDGVPHDDQQTIYPPSPDTDHVTQQSEYQRRQADKRGRTVLVPNKPKAAFQWPPDCLWPFIEGTRRD